MRRGFSNFGQYSLPIATIDENSISGSGGGHAPLLHITIQLDPPVERITPQEAVRFSSLNARLILPSTEIIFSQEKAINVLVDSGYSANASASVYLDFQLDSGRIEALEKVRNGNDLKLKINVSMRTERLVALNGSSSQKKAWGFVEEFDQRLEEEITIPRSVWVERVLPNIGYGKIHLIELPAVPLEAIAGLSHAFVALKQGQDLHRNGLYDDAVGKCRVALEPFFESVEIPTDDGNTRRIPKLKKSWEKKLGQATYTWLSDSLSGIKDVTNKSHHSPNPHYDQFESQMIQAITTTLIAYAARQEDF